MAQRERDTVIVSAARTPFGKFGGMLKDIPATDLGGQVIQEVVRRAGIAPDQVDYVYMGMVVQAGVGQIPSRQASIKAGLPYSVPSDTINKVCASSLRAVNLAHMQIRLADGDIIVAGGMESMSQAPYLVRGARWGLRMGDAPLVDAVVHDGLTCSFGSCHMGVYGSTVAKEFGITREAQDQWAYRSHMRALAARNAGLYHEEIVPVSVPGRKGESGLFEHDEAVRPDTTLEKLAALRPAFQADGTVTAGNAPGLNDGAAALLLMSRARAEELGLQTLATVVSTGQHSAEAPYLHTVPWGASVVALQRAGLRKDDIALWEINEAFAAVTLTSMKLGEIDPERVNVNGGAVAIGHPIGASGARLLMTLVYELRRRGGGYGVAAICSGGGQGEATLVKVEG